MLSGVPRCWQPTLQRGDLCLAQFSGDGQWYRSKVLHADTKDPTRPKYLVRYAKLMCPLCQFGGRLGRPVRLASSIHTQMQFLHLACDLDESVLLNEPVQSKGSLHVSWNAKHMGGRGCLTSASPDF